MYLIRGCATFVPAMVMALGGVMSPWAVAQVDEVPTEIQQPGTQPNQVPALTHSDNCAVCHGGYDDNAEPLHTWYGSLMSHASRDPLYWAAVAVSENNVPGVGDLCIRCHLPMGWYDGHSTPTDGSRLLEIESDGVNCDTCHTMTNPDDQEWLGNQLEPFIANDGGDPPRAYLGGSMISLWPGAERLGPYDDAHTSQHAWGKSNFHRSPEFCGSCHDVSNPLVGDLAPNSGTQPWSDPVVRSGVPGAPVEEKAAFNNYPHQYGVVERTFSENMSSGFPTLRVSDYASLPAELQAGSIKRSRDAAVAANPTGDYVDGDARYFTCQTCHMTPVNGRGSHLGPDRTDIPQHDLVGGNYWIPEVLTYMGDKGQLMIGNDITPEMRDGLDDGVDRALRNLREAGDISVTDNTVRVVNLTGHKLISGYPEGRRMWLNIKWFGRRGKLLREDGEYGDLLVNIRDEDITVRTLIDLHDPNTRIYRAEMGITSEWAALLKAVGFPGSLALAFDRETGDTLYTLGQLARRPAGEKAESMHFAMNNTMIHDNRIPPFGMDYEEGRKRNILPVPKEQYGDPGPAGTYNYWDEFEMSPPQKAVYAEIKLMYQPTSWEYIQFLFLANDGSNPRFATTGEDLMDGWLATGMAEPVVMDSAVWGRDGKSSGDPGDEIDPISMDRIDR